MYHANMAPGSKLASIQRSRESSYRFPKAHIDVVSKVSIWKESYEQGKKCCCECLKREDAEPQWLVPKRHQRNTQLTSLIPCQRPLACLFHQYQEHLHFGSCSDSFLFCFSVRLRADVAAAQKYSFLRQFWLTPPLSPPRGLASPARS